MTSQTPKATFATNLFVSAYRSILLADGKIGMDEMDQLLRLLDSNGNVVQSEKNCPKDVYDSADEAMPEFEELFAPV